MSSPDTPFSFQIDWKHLAAMALLATRDETRYILNGVHVEACPLGSPHALLVATDGRRLGVYRAAIPEPMPAGASVIIPLPLIAAARPKGKTEIVVEVTPHSGRRRLSIRQLGGAKAVSDFAVDGNYPNWRNVMPTTDMVAVPQVLVQLTYAADFVAIAKAFGSAKGTGAVLRTHAGPKNDAPVHTVIFLEHPGFIGVLMPVRSDADRPVPDWAKPVRPDPVQTPAPAPAPEPAPVPTPEPVASVAEPVAATEAPASPASS